MDSAISWLIWRTPGRKLSLGSYSIAVIFEDGASAGDLVEIEKIWERRGMADE
jgi:hypothetical protein